MAIKKISEFPDLPSELAADDDVLVERGAAGYKKDGAGFVVTTGAQSIAGVKTFTDSPVVPDTPSGGTAAINKNYADSSYSLFPPGMMAPYGGASAPTGWLLCDGSAVSRTTYANLFTAISTTYGVGNGSTTFNVPDMRAAAPVGAGTSTGYTQNETIALGAKLNDQMQGHRHAPLAGSYILETTNPSNGIAAAGANFGGANVISLTTGSPATDGTNGTPRTGNVTRGKVVAVNYIIKT
jgi:microcystin-dependent protein